MERVPVPKDAVIVKIQQSQFRSNGKKAILVYDETRTLFFESEDPEIVKPLTDLMKEKQKAYYWAKVVDTRLKIYDEVKEEKW